MQKGFISSKQAICILIMFIFGNALMYTASKAKQDTWLAMLIAVAMYVPMMLAYARILSLYPGQNLYDIIVHVFGKIFGRAIALVFALYAVHLGAMVMRNSSEFVKVSAMQETTQCLTLAFFFALSVWMVKSGMGTFGRWAGAVLPVVLLAVIITLLISIKFLDFSNLKPIAGTDFNTLMGSAFSIFSFPFADTILFTVIFCSVKAKSSPYKIFFIGLAISTFFFLMAVLRNTLVLGPSLSLYYFPSYVTVSILSLGEFFTRIEVFIGMAFLVDAFLKLCVCMFAASVGLSKLFNIKEYGDLAIPAGLLTLTLAIIIYTNTIEMYDFFDIYKYYALPFQVVLPLMILLGAEIKVRSTKRKQSCEKA